MSLTPEQFAALAGIIAAITAAGMAKKWVWGWTYRDMEADRDFWRRTALTAMGHTDKAITIAEKATQVDGA